MCSCLRGVSRWFTPLACGPGYPELSKSYMDMASKLFTFTFTFTMLTLILRLTDEASAKTRVRGM